MPLNPDLIAEFARLGLVYLHLLACCVALGLVLTSDFAMVKELLSGAHGPAPARRHEMESLQSLVSHALAFLWVTGAAIIAVDASAKGLEYFANPKLQAKILVVVLLTINGALLHRFVLPWMQKAGSLLDLEFSRSMMALLAGVVSGVSWLYAAMMGVGRPLAWKYSLLQLMAAYPLLIAGGFLSMLLVVTWCKYRSTESDFPATVFAGSAAR